MGKCPEYCGINKCLTERCISTAQANQGEFRIDACCCKQIRGGNALDMWLCPTNF